MDFGNLGGFDVKYNQPIPAANPIKPISKPSEPKIVPPIKPAYSFDQPSIKPSISV
jgi:hypothetical protein